MTKLIAPTDVAAFEVPGQDLLPPEKRIAYLFRPPGVHEAAAFERACIAAGARIWTPIHFLIAMAEGVRALLPGEEDAGQRDGLLAEIEAARQQLGELSKEYATLRDATPEEKGDWVLRWNAALTDPRMTELQALLSRHWPRLREMEADNGVAPALRGIEAARLFLVGWKNRPGKVRRGLQGVDDATLRSIPPELFPFFATFIDGLLRPTEAEAGNCASPSGGRSGRTPSPAARTRPRKVRSKTTSGTPKNSA